MMAMRDYARRPSQIDNTNRESDFGMFGTPLGLAGLIANSTLLCTMRRLCKLIILVMFRCLSKVLNEFETKQ